MEGGLGCAPILQGGGLNRSGGETKNSSLVLFLSDNLYPNVSSVVIF